MPKRYELVIQIQGKNDVKPADQEMKGIGNRGVRRQNKIALFATY
jgi:hypothetical protein